MRWPDGDPLDMDLSNPATRAVRRAAHLPASLARPTDVLALAGRTPANLPDLRLPRQVPRLRPAAGTGCDVRQMRFARSTSPVRADGRAVHDPGRCEVDAALRARGYPATEVQPAFPRLSRGGPGSRRCRLQLRH